MAKQLVDFITYKLCYKIFPCVLLTEFQIFMSFKLINMKHEKDDQFSEC